MIKLIYVMKKGKITLLCSLLAMLAFTTTYSQNTVYSTIAKNINSEANSLQHNLNRAGDTLHLNSDYNLYKVEFIGTYAAKVFEIERGKKRTSIPLASVPVGEYTIAAFQIEKSDDIYQYQKTIVFRISRLLPIEEPKIEEELIAELEPEIIEEEPIIKEEEAVVAEVIKGEPAKKQRVKKERVKKEIVKKERVKKERVKKERVKKERVKKERVIKEITEKKTRVAKTRTPRSKKEKTVSPEKKKREVIKKEAVKKEIVKEKKTRVTTKKTTKPRKESVVADKSVNDKTVTLTKPERKTRVVERKEPKLDSTEYKTYNLTNGRGGRYAVQSREEYRAENLRPNGEPYN